MSKIDFRLGNLTGRLAGMVGASWKGIDYIRKMVIPANPNTVAQQGTRTVFAWLVEKGRRINSTILKNYVIPKPKKMSPFNMFIKRNQPMIDAGAVTIGDMVIGKGGLYAPTSVLTEADSTTEEVTLTWTGEKQGEALDTDTVLCMAWNATQDLYYFSTDKVRSELASVIAAVGMAENDVVHGWIFFVQGTDLSSETLYDDTVAVS